RRMRDASWDWASHDKYVFSVINQLLADRCWSFDVALVPLFYGEPEGAGSDGDAAEFARSLPPGDVSWYIYCSITHAYSDGLSGQALFSDLLRFYSEEVSVASGSGSSQLRSSPPEAPEQFALLQQRLRRSLCGRTTGTASDPNNDVYHEVADEDWGKRAGICRRIYFAERVTRTLRAAASEVIGCGVDLAWLTACLGTMFRLFPD
ncbi:unnamed protein product, partial [Polarella glacialis]